jgi:ankyrin repeat protein
MLKIVTDVHLHLEVIWSISEGCKLLLRAGSQASLSTRDEFGETPLEIAMTSRLVAKVYFCATQAALSADAWMNVSKAY